MKKDDDDQTSTRLQVHDGTRVLKAGKSVVMVAWRAGMWRRNIKALIVIASIVLGIFVWKSFTNEDSTSADTQETPSNGAPKASTGPDITLPPVNYKVEGRGLVYNCKNKKYYCVDKDNYYKCRDLGKAGKSACMTRGVLDSTKLCNDELKNRSPQEVSCP